MPKPSTPGEGAYIWHVTVNTGHTRKSYRSEAADAVVAQIQGWLTSDRFDLPDGYTCVVLYRAAPCLEAQVLMPTGEPLVTIGIATHGRCGSALWRRIGRGERPAEPWCAARIEVDGANDIEALYWIADFERCLAWAWIEQNAKN